MGEAARELLASREDVWAYFVEPRHLSDWWPGIRTVEPDRRGFAQGARWRVMAVEEPNFSLLPTRRDRGSLVEQTLVVHEVAPYEFWAWELVGTVSRGRLAQSRRVRVAVSVVTLDQTRVTVGVTGRGNARDRRLAEAALDRLYDLVQTTATS